MDLVAAKSPYINFEIIGLYATNNVRACVQHACCGEHVRVGDVLRLRTVVVTIKKTPEEAVKLVKIVEGMETYTVGFIP